MRGHTKHRHNLSHHFIAYRCHLGLRIQFTPASEETGGIFEKIVAGVTGLEPATSCVTGRRSNQLSYTPGKGRENVAEVFSRSSGSAKKMIRTTDAKEVGVGNTAEETCRCPNRKAIFLPQLSSVNPQFSQPSTSVLAWVNLRKKIKNGGEGGIRTLVTLASNHAFQACAFNHSATSPPSGRALCVRIGGAASFLLILTRRLIWEGASK